MAVKYNDPIKKIIEIFEKRNSDKDVKIQIVQEIPESAADVYGETYFPDDGGTTIISIPVDKKLPFRGFIEIFAHELAHAAVGIKAGHGEVWEAEFQSINHEFNQTYINATIESELT